MSFRLISVHSQWVHDFPPESYDDQVTPCNRAAGLDIDALRDVANAVNGLKTDKTATLMVTHYKRLLNYIKPEHVHVMEVRTAAPCGPECCCHSRSLVPPEWQGR